EKPSKKVLFPDEYEDEECFKPTPSDTPADKTKALLTGLVKTLQHRTEDAVTVGVPNHAERALPKHPSLDVLKAASDVPAQVTEDLAKAHTTATTPMELDKTAFLYDKALQSFVRDYFNDDLSSMTGEGKKPAAGKTPAQFKELILTNAQPTLLRFGDPDVARK